MPKRKQKGYRVRNLKAKKMQTFDYLFQVQSTIKYDKRGLQHQVAYYGSNTNETKEDILEKAKQNIVRKLETSKGELKTINISAVYHGVDMRGFPSLTHKKKKKK